MLEDGARPIGPHHFVIPHVDDEKVRLMGGAVAGDLHRHVRVDRGHRPIDHFKLHVRVAISQQRFQDPPNAKGRVRNALRRRTPENEDADGPGRFGRKKARGRRAGERPREESPSKLQIGPANSVGVRTDKEARRITVVPQPQPGLQHAEEEQRRENHDRQAKQPLAPSAERGPRRRGTVPSSAAQSAGGFEPLDSLCFRLLADMPRPRAKISAGWISTDLGAILP